MNLTQHRDSAASQLALEHPWPGVYSCTLCVTGKSRDETDYKETRQAILCARNINRLLDLSFYFQPLF